MKLLIFNSADLQKWQFHMIQFKVISSIKMLPESLVLTFYLIDSGFLYFFGWIMFAVDQIGLFYIYYSNFWKFENNQMFG